MRNVANRGAENMDNPTEEARNMPLQIAMARILMLCFFAEHDISLNIADHFCDMTKRMFPDSAIARGLHQKRTKATDMTKKMASCITADLAKDLQRYKFSIIVDETTDCSKHKCFAILVKYLDESENTIKTKIFDLKDVYSNENALVGSTGEALYEMIKSTLIFHMIPFDNVVGFSADTTSNMFGIHNSIVSRLHRDFPNIACFKCKCHSFALCASEAAKTLPRWVETLLRNVFNFFSHSAKRRYEYETFQEIHEIEPSQLLHPSITRWLSYFEAVKRFVQHYGPLKGFPLEFNLMNI